MDGLDDLAMALAIGLPIVLVSAGGIFVALTDVRPASPPREAGSTPLPDLEDEASDATVTGRNR